MSLVNSILFITQSLPEGCVFSAGDFLHLGSRAAIDQVFTRLVKCGSILRIERGLYVMPVKGKYGFRAPSSDLVLASIEAKYGEVIVETGATAANVFGLTTQVPVRAILITSGRSKKLTLGKYIIEIRHGERWQYVLGKSAAGSAIRALARMGAGCANETVLNLKRKLTLPEWELMWSVRAVLPEWMSQAIYEARR